MRISDWSSDVCSSDLLTIAPFLEIARLDLIFRRTMMLQPDAAHLVGDGEQEVIMVEMIGAEQRARLIDQLLVLRDLVRLGVQLVRIVGDDVERHIMAEIDRLEMEARENRRILQRLIINRPIENGRTSGRERVCKDGVIP